MEKSDKFQRYEHLPLGQISQQIVTDDPQNQQTPSDTLTSQNEGNESLQGLYGEIQRLEKESLERSENLLLLLINLITLKKNQKDVYESLQAFTPQYIQQIVNKMIKVFSQEQFLDDEKHAQLTQDLSQLLEKEQWKSMITYLKRIKDDNIALDISRLKYILERTQQAKDVLKGKDVIIFLGFTGNGKSTTIHFLAGSEMELVQVQQPKGPVYHVQPKVIKIEEAKKVITNPMTQSETKFITPVPIKYDGKDYLLVDSPGFKDTEGPIIDIVNGIGVISALKMAKSVKPVIVFKFESLDGRLGGLLDLTMILSNMINGLNDSIESFQFVFNGFTVEKIASLPGLVGHLRESQSDDESESSFTLLLKELAEKLEDGKVFFLDPINDSPRTLLKEFTKGIKITDPYTKFKNFYTDKAHSVINYLDDLLFLKDTLNLREVNDCYSKCMRQTERQFNLLFKESTSNFMTFMRLENTLTLSVIDKFKESILLDLQGHCLRNSHFENEGSILPAGQYHIFVQEETLKLLHQSQRSDIRIKDLESYLLKLQIMATGFDNCRQHFETLKSYLIESLDKLTSEITSQYDNHDQRFHLINKFQKLIKVIGNFINNEIIETNIQKIIAAFQQEIDERYSKIQQLFNAGKADQQTYDQALELISYFDNIKASFSDQDLVPNEIFEWALNNMNTFFNNLFQENLQCAIEIYDQKSIADYMKLKDYLQQLQLMKTNIQLITNDKIDKYQQLMQQVITFVLSERDDIDVYIMTISKNQDVNRFEKLDQKLSQFLSFSWINLLQDNIYNEHIQKIKDKIFDQISALKSQAFSINLNLKNISNLKEMMEVMFQIQKFSEISFIKQEFQESIFVQLQQHISQQIQKIMSKITGDIEKWKQTKNEDSYYSQLSHHDFENYLYIINNFIQLRDNSKIITQELRNAVEQSEFLSNDIETLILAYRDDVFKTIKDSLKAIEGFDGKNRNDLTEPASLLQLKFQEVYYLYNDQQNLFNIHQLFFQSKLGFVGEFLKDLKTFQSNLTTQMNNCLSTSNFIEIRIKLNILEEMRKFDEYFKDHSFNETYQSFFTIYLQKQPELLTSNYTAIKEYKFDQVFGLLTTLQEHSSDINFAKNLSDLNLYLKSTVEELKSSARSLVKRTKLRFKGNSESEKLIDDIIFKLDKLKEAIIFETKQFLTNTNIQETINEVQQTLNDNFCKQMSNVEDLVKTYNFKDAEKIQEELDFYQGKIQNYASDELQEKVHKFEENKKSQLEIILKSYDEESLQQITDILFRPTKEIYLKLSELKHISIYHEKLAQFEDMLKNRFLKELEKIKTSQDVYQKKSMIQQLKACVRSMPDHLENSLTLRIEQVDEIIKSEQERIDADINETINNKDITRLQQILNNDKDNTGKIDSKHIRMIQDYLKKDDKHYHQQIHQAVDSRGFTENILYDLEKYTQINMVYHQHYKQEFLNFSKTKQEIQQKLSKSLNLLRQKYEDIDEEKEEPSPFDQNNSREKYYYEEDDNQSCYGDFYAKNNENSIPYQVKQVQNFIKFRTSCEYYKEIIKNFDSIIIKELTIFNNNIKEAQASFTQNLVQKKTQEANIVKKALEKYSYILKKLKKSLEDMKSHMEDTQDEKNEHFQNLLQELYSSEYDKNAKLTISNKILRLQEELTEYLDIIKGFQIENGPETKFYDQLVQTLQEEQNQLFTAVKSIKINDIQSQQYCQSYNENYQVLKVALENLDPVFQAKTDLKEVEQKMITVAGQLTKKFKEAEKDQENQFVLEVKCISQMKMISTIISGFRDIVEKEIDQILAQKNKDCGITYLAKMRNELEKDQFGSLVVTENSLFQGFQTSIFNEKTQKFGIDYIIKNMRDDNNKVDTSYLKRYYEKFEADYQFQVKQYLSAVESERISNMKALIQEILSLQKPKKAQDLEKFRGSFKEDIWKYVQKLFTLLTVWKSQNYFAAYSLDNKESFLLKPHAAQVIAIFRMLGLGTFEDELKNNLVQIGTGEGKSIVLAVVSSILALIGYDVYIACYSKYLCERDGDSFAEFYQMLGIESQIIYGTFNELCEKIINKDFEVRKTIADLIVSTKNKVNLQPQKPQILLIDEADVFFSMDFYGETYCPITLLKSPHISEIVDFIWNSKGSNYNVNHKAIVNSQQYANMLSSLGQWRQLGEEAVKDMINDIRQISAHHYKVQNGKIGYVVQDNIVFNQSYGYKTMFAYYQEHQNGKISNETLNSNKYITVKCGEYSYAEIPKRFCKIIGVTGTLETLTIEQKNMIKKEYKINLFTYMPSVFGSNQLKFDKREDVVICEPLEHKNQIVIEINKKIENLRSVLVFFETQKELDEFLDSKEFQLLKPMVVQEKRILTEELNNEEKTQRIKVTTQSQAVNLLTRTFGRGTDFVQRDNSVKDRGGVHVIQTFISQEISEEVQMKGRTARQGDQGSFQIVISKEQLEKFSFNTDELKQNPTYQDIDTRRQNLFRTLILNNEQKVRTASIQHSKSMEFLNLIKKEDFTNAEKILTEWNLGFLGLPTSSTIVLMDATGSMSALLEKSKLTVATMFERLQVILKEAGLLETEFELQFAAYRNYSSGEENILQASPWTSKSSELQQFLKNIRVSGGQGNEAIEVGLHHVTRQIDSGQQVSQVVLIGDAAPNTEGEIQSKRYGYTGRIYNTWQHSWVDQVQHYAYELNNLIKRGVPVNAFYVDEYAHQSFQQIAQMSKGRCQYLDIDSGKGALLLTDIVSKLVLQNVGEKRGLGKQLVEKYEKKYYH